MEIPFPAGDPPAEAPITGRIAGGTELSWCRAVPAGTGITVLALLLSRSPSLSRLRSSLRQLQLSHPILRSLLPSAAAAAGGKPPAILISPTPSDHIDIIPFNPPADFHLILEQELNWNPWAEPDDKKPVRSFFASVYELREPVQYVLVLRFHTGACDRIAGVTILRELMDLMLKGEDEGVGREGEVGLAIEDLIRKEDAYKPFWARGKDLIGYSLNGLRSSGLGFEDAGSDRKSEFVRLVMDEEATKRLLNVRWMVVLVFFAFWLLCLVVYVEE